MRNTDIHFFLTDVELMWVSKGVVELLISPSVAGGRRQVSQMW